MQRKFTLVFKVQVALAAISNQATVSEIVEKYNVSKTMLYQWKDELLANASKAFESDWTARQHDKQIDNLHHKIGELEMELDFTQWASKALGIGLPAKD